MSRYRTPFVVGILFLVVMRTTLAIPQNNLKAGTTDTAGIVLVVKDPAGVAIAKAHVKLTRTPGEFQAEGMTNEAGEWKMSGLAAGLYVIETSMPGFSVDKEDLNLEPQTIANRAVTLKLATCCTGPQVEPVHKNRLSRFFRKLL